MFEQISFKDYLKLDRLSSSGIKDLKKSPSYYKWKKDHPEETKEMILGRAIHSAILTPDLFNIEYAKEPNKKDFKFVTFDDLKPLLEKHSLKKTGKKEELLAALSPLLTMEERKQIYDFSLQAFHLESSGKEVLSNEDYEQCVAIANSFISSSKIKNMLSKGYVEQTILFEIDGVEMKCRLDFISDNFIMDIKTTKDASKEAFSRDFIKLGYDLQFGLYQEAVRITTGKKLPVVIFALEKEDNLDYSPFEVQQVLLDSGLKKAKKLIAIYKKCKESNEWEGLSKDIQELEIPSWYSLEV